MLLKQMTELSRWLFTNPNTFLYFIQDDADRFQMIGTFSDEPGDMPRSFEVSCMQFVHPERGDMEYVTLASLDPKFIQRIERELEATILPIHA